MGMEYGFKEWSFICEALGQAAQTIILRKGGIHEGRGGFHFQQEAFWLFPTGFHNQGELLRWKPENAEAIAVPQDEKRERVDIRYFAKLHRVWRITEWEKVAALQPFHVWTEQTIRDRFAWNEESCLHVALVRVYKLPSEAPVWSFPYVPGYGGCRSWVKLPEEGAALHESLVTVMPDGEWSEVAHRVESTLS
jgi:hypothetical protein